MSELLPDHDYRTLWHAACKDLGQLHDELQDKNGQINRLKHEIQSIEYALSDERINNTMGASDVAHEMRCELDTLRAELETERCLSFRNQVAELQTELDALKSQKPVAWSSLGLAVTQSEGEAARWEHKGWDVVPLYAAPTPPSAPDTKITSADLDRCKKEMLEIAERYVTPDGWELVPTELGTELYDACNRAVRKGYGWHDLDELMERIDDAYALKPPAAAQKPGEES